LTENIGEDNFCENPLTNRKRQYIIYLQTDEKEKYPARLALQRAADGAIAAGGGG
jgi:hypothetical protein